MGVAYAFGHDLVREVVYQDAGAARRAALHRRALAALESEGAPAAELARHALAAGAVEAALRHSIQAGDASLAVFAVPDGLAHDERARGLLERGVTAPQEEVMRLYANLGRAHDAAGARDAAHGAYEELLSHGRRSGEPALAAEAFNLYLAQDGLRLDEARALLEEALSLAARAGVPAVEAEMHLSVAQVAIVAWKMDIAAREAVRARQVARAGGIAELEARCLFLNALTDLWAGRFDDSRTRCHEAIAAFRGLATRGAGATVPLQQLWASAPWAPSWSRAAQLRAMEGQCHSLLSCAEANRGEAAAGRAAGYAGLHLAEEAHDDWGWAYTAVNLATALVEGGDYAEARRLKQRADEIMRALPITNLRPSVPLRSGMTHLAVLDLAQARAATLEALTFLGPEASATQAWRVLALSGLCAGHALAGAWGEAAAYARAAAETRVQMGVELLPADFLRHHETKALLRDGDVVAARRSVTRLTGCVGVNKRYRLVLLRMQAVLARWDGAAAEAIGRLKDALELATRMRLPGERWEILAELAAQHRKRGDVAEAAQAASEAHAIVEELAVRLGDSSQGRDFRTRALARVAGRDPSNAPTDPDYRLPC
jgi:hypothetical protein